MSTHKHSLLKVYFTWMLYLFLGSFSFTAQAESWSSGGSMASSREGFTSTLLLNKKVLVTGGWGDRTTFAELYDPATNAWSTVDSTQIWRYGHTATLLLNGNVLVAGGWSDDSIATTQMYDPTGNTWSTINPMTLGRRNHTATLLNNGKVLVAGGGLGKLNEVTATAELFDPATNTWKSTDTMDIARSIYTATRLPNGKVLVAGGFMDSSENITPTAELYDPATNTWIAAGSMNTTRAAHTATLLSNGKVLVVGGYDSISSSSSLSSAEVYDPDTNMWSTTGSMVTPRYSSVATLLPNGKVLVAGGVLDLNYDPVVTETSELYDPTTKTWSLTDPMSTTRFGHTATLLPATSLFPNGQVLVTGGRICRFCSDTATAELYTPKPPGVGGTLTKISAINGKVTCQNMKTKQKVVFSFTAGIRSWDCEANGLLVKSKETVKQTISVTGRTD